jgi:hypothetical protein
MKGLVTKLKREVALFYKTFFFVIDAKENKLVFVSDNHF